MSIAWNVAKEWLMFENAEVIFRVLTKFVKERKLWVYIHLYVLIARHLRNVVWNPSLIVGDIVVKIIIVRDVLLFAVNLETGCLMRMAEKWKNVRIVAAISTLIDFI